MGLLIDSTALLDMLGHPQPVIADGSPEDEFYLSIITADELLRSVARCGGRDRTRRLAFVEAVLDKFPILPMDRPTVRMHAEILSAFGRGTEKMGLHESWIAATCLAHGLGLLSNNPGCFATVNGLRICRFGAD